MMDALTPEQARTIELSANPLRRLGQLAELGSGFHTKKVGSSPLPQYMTRGDLVRAAEAHEAAVDAMNAINTIEELEQGE